MNKHASSPYNPNIAHVFYLAGFIESWERGIEKICSACEKDGVPQPEYTINPGDIMIRQPRTIAEASAVESPIRQETIGFPAHFFARAHNFKPPGRACQPEADSPMRT